MAPIFKIYLLEDESDKSFENKFVVLIEPRLPNFDSFKETIYRRFQALKNRPLFMYYYDNVDKVILNTSMDFDLFQKQWSTTFKDIPNLYVCIVINPTLKVWTNTSSNDAGELVSKQPNITKNLRPRFLTMKFEKQRKKSNILRLPGKRISSPPSVQTVVSNTEEKDGVCGKEIEKPKANILFDCEKKFFCQLETNIHSLEKLLGKLQEDKKELENREPTAEEWNLWKNRFEKVREDNAKQMQLYKMYTDAQAPVEANGMNAENAIDIGDYENEIGNTLLEYPWDKI